MKKTIIILPLLILLLLAFAPPLNLTNGWYQQYMPNLGGRNIVDITFTDSLRGYAITNRLTTGDTSFILKTTNSGDNWIKVYGETTNSILKRIIFINQNTGFVGGLINFNYILKTSNSGQNWFYINAPYNIAAEDMSVLNDTTIWIAMSESLTGGVFRTTNGGSSWDHQFSGGNQNPNKIYMYNARIGFISNSSASPNIYKTTNSGENWNILVSGQYMRDVQFIDSLTGWYSYINNVYKTTNGGLNWITQLLPSGGTIITSGIDMFSVLNKDTVWGTGGTVFYGAGQFRGMIYRTINGGNNWLFQVADTTIHIPAYKYIKFINSRIGWSYSLGLGGIHTTNGGDTIFYTGIQQVSSNIPKEFKLYQNYPNPFNPSTNIIFQIKRLANIKLSVYDVTGKEITALTDKEYKAGTYEVIFNSANFSSGIYFYSLIVNNQLIDTKKMVLLK